MSVLDQTYDAAIPLAELTEHPDNPRRGDDRTVAESIDANGFFGAVIVQQSTGRVLAGNTRYRAMVASGATTIPGFFVDVDDEAAKKIMLIDNRAADLAFYDDAQLLANLQEMVGTANGLDGTGYDQAAYEMLLGSINGLEGVGGAAQGAVPTDRAADYEAGDVRSIILPYDGDDFSDMIDRLTALRSAMSLETNAAVVRALVLDATS